MPFVWLSVDPVRKQIDFYPRAIATRVEQSFADWHLSSTLVPGECVLGTDFFNSTVHFHPSGICFQTTPGVSMGRGGYKQPGYRTVKRLEVESAGETLQLYAKRRGGEWRFCDEPDAEHSFEVVVPEGSLVDALHNSPSSVVTSFKPWKGADIEACAWDLPVVVWQWCRGVPEKDGALLSLPEDWWCPYLEEVNELIETGFSTNQVSVLVEAGERTYNVNFTPNSSFALQRDDARNKERVMRRVIKTVQELKTSLAGISRPPKMSIKQLMDSLPDGTIPHHFFCPILQDVMEQPVKTVDGHTYSRSAIHKWLQSHDTAPLTGLVLPSKALTPNTELEEQMETFFAEQQAANADVAIITNGISSTTVSS
mmetsp:Transcript_5901/g.14984  ORF Transcript_5901/g.14984 Transcript_5901/m.14984 type:complete len:368 (-) Transcript_5901:246-1349(-)